MFFLFIYLKNRKIPVISCPPIFTMYYFKNYCVRKRKNMRYILILTLTIVFGLSSCERDEITRDSSAKIDFSQDTVSFDTVFSTIGSATKKLMIYNKNEQAIEISNIRLFGGNTSAFKINIDGVSGSEVSNVRIEAKDSAYVFVQVYVDPTNINSPVLLEDSLELLSNGNRFTIKFRALGQDVHLLKGDSVRISSNTNWINDKPYLIWGNLFIDSFKTLTIEQGVTIYLHSKTWIIADGTIKINGTKEQMVTFRGDRRDNANFAPPIPYDKIPGQWGQIWLRNSSKANVFNYAFIRNAEFGLIVGNIKDPDKPDNGQAEIELYNCRLENFSICALYGNGGKVKAVNSIFANSGYFNFSTSTGGNYEFYHCTFANYQAIGEKKGIGILLRNYVEVPDDSIENKKVTFTGDLEKAYFGNCIIYGDIENQLVFVPNKENKMEYMFDHCLIRGNTDKLNISDEKHYIKPKVSKEIVTIFAKTDKDKYIYDWNLVRKSLARDYGNPEISAQALYDYNNNYRLNDEIPDLGAFEYIETEE